MSYMGDHVWLITSRHTEPDLAAQLDLVEILPWVNFRVSQLINIGVVNSVDEPDARALVRVLIG